MLVIIKAMPNFFQAGTIIIMNMQCSQLVPVDWCYDIGYIVHDLWAVTKKSKCYCSSKLSSSIIIQSMFYTWKHCVKGITTAIVIISSWNTCVFGSLSNFKSYILANPQVLSAIFFFWGSCHFGLQIFKIFIPVFLSFKEHLSIPLRLSQV